MIKQLLLKELYNQDRLGYFRRMAGIYAFYIQ